jgi:hypothetical protein
VKLELESTTKIVTLNGVPARVWQGKTASGIPVFAFITRLAVDRDEPCEEFEHELEEQHAAPRPEVAAFESRLIL